MSEKRFHKVTGICSCGQVGEITIIASNPCTLEIREPTWGEALEALGASLTKSDMEPNNENSN